jgi:hypothetical protein
MAALCKILALLKANKARGGDRTKKLFQFLNEIGARALGRHLGRVLEMAEDSATKWEYEAKIAKRFGFEQQLELPIPMPPYRAPKGRQLRRPIPYVRPPSAARLEPSLSTRRARREL